jgi:hypothetical protein
MKGTEEFEELEDLENRGQQILRRLVEPDEVAAKRG